MNSENSSKIIYELSVGSYLSKDVISYKMQGITDHLLKTGHKVFLISDKKYRLKLL